MKQIITTLVVLSCFLAGLLLLGITPTRTLAEANQTNFNASENQACQTERSINVIGTAVINVIPDRALIQLGVQSNGASPREVAQVNEITIQEVVKTIEGVGVAPKDIVTDRYIIEPVYDSYESLYIKGYRIHNLIAVTLRDVEKVGEVIVAALEAGVNQVIDVEFYINDLRQYRDQARSLAMEAALEKAQDLSRAAGVEVGCVISILENTWSAYNGWWYPRNRDLWTQNVIQNASPDSGASYADQEGPLKLGQIAVRAEINATFALE